MKRHLSMILAAVLTSSSMAEPSAEVQKPLYQFGPSDRAEFDYTFEKFYLTAPASFDSAARKRAQRACEDKAADYVRLKSEGYKVVKSFGTSDEEQIAYGTLACLHEAGWKIHESRDGKLVSVNTQEIFNQFMGGRK